MKFNKAYEIRELVRRSVGASNLVSALFEDIPELQSIKFQYSQEYDDNNYSDYCRLTEVNGHYVDCEGDYEENHDESDLPRLSKREVLLCDELIQTVASEYGYDEHELSRSNYPPQTNRLNGSLEKAEADYLCSYLAGTPLKKSWFFKKDAKWACYYAMDYGRFDEEVEFKIFAKKGGMVYAYWYSAHVIKGRLPEPIESFFILSAEKGEDHEWLQKYMKLREGFLEKNQNSAVV